MSQRTRLFLATLLAGVFCAAPGRAQTADSEFERILVPVFTVHPLPGAGGSLWRTDLWIRNNGPEAVRIDGYDYFGCSVTACPLLPGPPPARPLVAFRPVGASRFLRVERVRAAQVAVNLRVVNLSSSDGSAGVAGVEVPTPRESEFHAGVTTLMNVPTGPAFRRVLRVYALDPGRGGEVMVRIHGANAAARNADFGGAPDPLLGESTIVLSPAQLDLGYTEMTDLPGIDSAQHERVTVLVEPAADALRIWAFLSVVHNETQQLTVVSPQ